MLIIKKNLIYINDPIKHIEGWPPTWLQQKSLQEYKIVNDDENEVEDKKFKGQKCLHI